MVPRCESVKQRVVVPQASANDPRRDAAATEAAHNMEWTEDPDEAAS
jgi:hypothetical protein